MVDQAFPAKELPHTRSQLHQDVYSNQVTANLGPYDMTLVFGRIKQPPGAPTPIVEDQVSVTLPPQQFKLLAELCARITEAYEKAYVPIQLSEGDQQKKMSADEIVERIRNALSAAQAASEPARSTPTNALKPPARRVLRQGVRKTR